MGVLLKRPRADLGERECALGDTEGVLVAAADLGLGYVAGPLGRAHDAPGPVAVAGGVLRLGGILPEDVGRP